MFVAGDKRGYRLSKVLGIDMSDEDYPVRVDTEEPCVADPPRLGAGNGELTVGATGCP